jgi:hypothetical protein
VRIFRHTVPVDDRWHRVVTQGSIVHVATRDVRVAEIWARHVDGAAPQVRWMRVYGTGQDIPDDLVYLGTCVAPEGLVWHLVENPHIDPGDSPAEQVDAQAGRPRLAAA